MRFEEALRVCLEGIPPRKAATCGTVARALGDMRAARAVATWLLEHPGEEAGHRVVRADGRPVLPGALEVLRREGVTLVSGRVAQRCLVKRVAAVHFLDRLRAEQESLATRVREEAPPTEPGTLGGVDVSYAGDHAFAALVILDATDLDIVEAHVTELEVDFPYIPSYLAFREFPAIAEVMRRVSRTPDVLFVDGHGRLHPRLFGMACYVGVRLDLPTIGVAKHALVGTPLAGQPSRHGAVPIQLEGVVRGYAWIPPGRTRPFYVSVGNRISLEGALGIAQRATRVAYPEPVRSADRLSKEKKKWKNGERSASGKTAPGRPPAQGRQGV